MLQHKSPCMVQFFDQYAANNATSPQPPPPLGRWPSHLANVSSTSTQSDGQCSSPVSPPAAQALPASLPLGCSDNHQRPAAASLANTHLAAPASPPAPCNQWYNLLPESVQPPCISTTSPLCTTTSSYTRCLCTQLDQQQPAAAIQQHLDWRPATATVGQRPSPSCFHTCWCCPPPHLSLWRAG